MRKFAALVQYVLVALAVASSVDNSQAAVVELTSMSTDSGIDGTVLDLYGSGFTGASSVTFNMWSGNSSHGVPFSVLSDSVIQVTVPDLSGYKGSAAAITVVTPQGATVTLPSNVVQITSVVNGGDGSSYFWVRNGGSLSGAGGSSIFFVDSGGAVTENGSGGEMFFIESGGTLNGGGGG